MKRKDRIVGFLAFLLLGILAIFVFPSLGLMANSDSYLGIHSLVFFENISNSWVNVINGGSEVSFSSGLYSMLFYVFLNMINLSISNAGVMILMFLISWLVAYKIITLFIPTKDDLLLKICLILLSSLIISFPGNRIFIVAVTTVLWGKMFMLLSIYFYLLTFIKNKSYLYTLISVMFLNISFIDTMSAIICLIFILVFTTTLLLISFLKKGTEVIDTPYIIRKTIPFGLMFLVTNFYWIFFTIMSLLSKTSSSVGMLTKGETTTVILDYINSLNNLGYNLILSRPNYFHTNIYPQLIINLQISSLFVLLFLVVYGIKHVFVEHDFKKKLYLLTFLIMFLIFTTFSFGPKDLFGAFSFLWVNFSGFRIFRDFFKFHRLIEPLILIVGSYGLYMFIRTGSFVKRYVALLVSISIFVLNILPYYYLYPFYKPFKVPGYYFSLSESLVNSPYDDIVSIFPAIGWHQRYTWSNQLYDMADPLSVLLYKPVHISLGSYEITPPQILQREASKYLSEGDFVTFNKLLNIRGVNRLIIRKDLQQAYLFDRLRFDDFNTILNYEKLIEQADTFFNVKQVFGDLHLYTLGIDKVTPIVYVPDCLVTTDGDISDIGRLLKDLLCNRPALIFNSQNVVLPKDISTVSNAPTLEYRKISPSRYVINVHNSKEPFPLVFSQNFNIGWKLFLANLDKSPSHNIDKLSAYNFNDSIYSIGEESFAERISKGLVYYDQDLASKEQYIYNIEPYTKRISSRVPYNIGYISNDMNGVIQNNNLQGYPFYKYWNATPVAPEDSHFVANSYSNMWMLNPVEICAKGDLCEMDSLGYSFKLILEFTPQKNYYISMILSIGVAFICLILFTLYNLVYSRRGTYNA